MTSGELHERTAAEIAEALALANKQHVEIQDALRDLKQAGQRIEDNVVTSLDNFAKVRERLEQLVKGMRGQ